MTASFDIPAGPRRRFRWIAVALLACILLAFQVLGSAHAHEPRDLDHGHEHEQEHRACQLCVLTASEEDEGVDDQAEAGDGPWATSPTGSLRCPTVSDSVAPVGQALPIRKAHARRSSARAPPSR